MRTFLVACSLAIWLTACTGRISTGDVTPTPGATQTAPESSSQRAPTAALLPSQEAPGGQPSALILGVFAPQDGSVSNTPQVEIIGFAPPEAVISINDQIVVVGPEGEFRATVILDVGPNLIELVASDLSGTEITQNLTISYEP